MFGILAQAASDEVSWVRSLVDSAAYAVEKIGWPGAILLAMIIIGGYWLRRMAPKMELESESRTKLNDTLTEHIPQQTETVKKLSEQGSYLIREVSSTKEAAGELSYALEAMAHPDFKAETARYLARARQRLGIEKKPAKQSDSDS